MNEIDFSKGNGLVPAIVQDAQTDKVLMLGHMDQAAIDKTNALGKVTFFSRSKQRLWTKGESSGNYLELVSMEADCDRDALLIKANPKGPACHTGADTCWNEQNIPTSFFHHLERVIQNRIDNPKCGSYINRLLQKNINWVAQKVGEEAVELVIEAKDNDKELFMNEAADLIWHYIILVRAKGYSLSDVEDVLRIRASR